MVSPCRTKTSSWRPTWKGKGMDRSPCPLPRVSAPAMVPLISTVSTVPSGRFTFLTYSSS